MLKVAISFDYDTPIGYKQSFNIQDLQDDAEIIGTNKLLGLLSQYEIKTTFGIVGKILIDKRYGNNFIDQILNIKEQGHEICSHSFSHKFLPSLSRSELIKEIKYGKDLIDEYIQTSIIGFILPFNRPMSFLSKGAISLSELFGIHGRGFGGNTLDIIIPILINNGYKWVRTSHKNKLRQIINLLQGKEEPKQPFFHKSLNVIPLHCSGFGEDSIRLIQSKIGKDIIISVYAHPHQAANIGDKQSVFQFGKFLDVLIKSRDQGLIDFIRMNEVADYI